ncbi:hypothetical protein ACFL4T_05300 [candidate division KSB1 bacterium]
MSNFFLAFLTVETLGSASPFPRRGVGTTGRYGSPFSPPLFNCGTGGNDTVTELQAISEGVL